MTRNAIEERLKQAAIRDRDLNLEITNDWLAVDREQWQQVDIHEKHTSQSAKDLKTGRYEP